MKRLRRYLPLAVLVFIALAAGCRKAGEVAINSAPARMEYNYAFDKKEVYVADASNDLEALDQKLKSLAAQAGNASTTLRTNALVRIQALRNQRAALNQKLLALQSASETGWNNAKDDFVKTFAEAKTSCQQAGQWLGANADSPSAKQ